MHHPPPAIPATGTLPGCFSPAMVAGLIRALPRPTAADAAELGRQTLHEVLAMISLYRPCDVIEALLVQQIAILHVRAPLAAALAAASEDTPESMVRYERHMMAQLRGAGALERRLGIYRREQAARGCAPAADEPWDYDLAAMEALWREAHTQQAAAGAPTAPAPGMAGPTRQAAGTRQGDAPSPAEADASAEAGTPDATAAAAADAAAGTRLPASGAARPETTRPAGGPAERHGERTQAVGGAVSRAA